MNLLSSILPIATDNYVAFTFFIGTMAMMAASVFFFFESRGSTKRKLGNQISQKMLAGNSNNFVTHRYRG